MLHILTKMIATNSYETVTNSYETVTNCYENVTISYANVTKYYETVRKYYENVSNCRKNKTMLENTKISHATPNAWLKGRHSLEQFGGEIVAFSTLNVPPKT